MIPAVLVAAALLVGQPPAAINSDGRFWCADLVRHLAPTVVWPPDPGPSDVAWRLPTGTGQPGDVVLIDLFPGNDVAEHVAVLERVTADGVDVVEANGAGDPAHVARGHYPTSVVLGYRQLPAPAVKAKPTRKAYRRPTHRRTVHRRVVRRPRTGTMLRAL